MVTEPSVDEELVPKNEDENGNQEILMDQVFLKIGDNHNHDDLEKEEKEKIKNEKNDILTTIQATGKLEKEIEDSLIQIIEDYKKSKK